MNDSQDTRGQPPAAGTGRTVKVSREAILDQLPAIVRRLGDSVTGLRWFAGKGRTVRDVALEDSVVLDELPLSILALARFDYESGAGDRYSLPLLFCTEADAPRYVPPDARPLLAWDFGGERLPIFDATSARPFQQALPRLVRTNRELKGAQGDVHCLWLSRSDELPTGEEPRLLAAEQSNTSIAYGRSCVVKLLRRLEEGLSRDVEVGRFLTEQRFPHAPELLGTMEYQRPHAQPSTLAILQRFVANEGDGWSYVLRHLREAYQGGALEFPLLAEMHELGRITGRLHLALASRQDLPEFAPEAADEQDVAEWQADLQAQLTSALTAARAALPAASPRLAAALREFLESEEALTQESAGLTRGIDPRGVLRIQIHGDYHLGQILKTPHGFTVIDFEGEPARPLSERRLKQPAHRDVSGMLRSLHYAAFSALPEDAREDAGALAWVEQWRANAGEAYCRGWVEETGNRFGPATGEGLDALLRLFSFVKVFYEVRYELGSRPDWAFVPLAGIRTMRQPESAG